MCVLYVLVSFLFSLLISCVTLSKILSWPFFIYIWVTMTSREFRNFSCKSTLVFCLNLQLKFILLVFIFYANCCLRFWKKKRSSRVFKFPVKYVFVRCDRICFSAWRYFTQGNHSVATVISITAWCWTFFLNSILHSGIWNISWVMNPVFLRFWHINFVNRCRQIFVFARISFSFLGGAEQISWWRACGELCCCASVEALCHQRIPAAGICKYDIRLMILSGIYTIFQWNLFIQALPCMTC